MRERERERERTKTINNIIINKYNIILSILYYDNNDNIYNNININIIISVYFFLLKITLSFKKPNVFIN